MQEGSPAFMFEKWAIFKGYKLNRRSEAKPPYMLLYEDSTTQATWAGYNQGG